jgi:NAD(P)-dependent dehydrogenase (short-subunit alcohol dehydrogenase family)
MTGPLASRLAVVTGASRGIGRAAALAYARDGAHVIAVARTVGALEELDDEIRAAGGAATLVPIDLTDFDALDRLAAIILERWGKLDILLGNAGVLGPLSPIGHVDPKSWANVMAVNVTANWRLIRAMDPLLRASDAGRALFVSSGAATKCTAYWGPYSVSKAALEALVRTYAAETRTSALKVNLVNPGPLRTRMRAQAMPGEDPMSLPTPEDLAPHILRLTSPDYSETGVLFDFPTGETRAFELRGYL